MRRRCQHLHKLVVDLLRERICRHGMNHHGFGGADVEHNQDRLARARDAGAFPVREKAIGSVTVLIGQAGYATVAGTISGVTPGRSWWRYVVRDKGRFPQPGGFSVTPGNAYEVSLRGTDRNGNSVNSEKWGPYELAPGAIVDFELSA